MSREIKFRCYDTALCRWVNMNGDISPGVFWEHGEMLPIQGFFELSQFTGLKDKNGVEIYFQDLLEVRFDVWDGEGKYHAVYEVIDGFGGGFQLRMSKLYAPEEAYFNITLGADDLREDYVNQCYDQLAIMDKWETRRTPTGDKRVHERFYTNDIAVIGNVFENPELLNVTTNAVSAAETTEGTESTK